MKYKMRIVGILCLLGSVGLGWGLAQEQAAQPAQPQASPATIEEAVMCEGVVDRTPQGIHQAPAQPEAQPAGQVQSAGGGDPFPFGKVYCFTKLSGPAPTSIKHVWYYGEKKVNTVELEIGGSPWRTWSYGTVGADMAGSWKVEIQDAGGAVLKTLTFEVK
jgi:hypothetical protein